MNIFILISNMLLYYIVNTYYFSYFLFVLFKKTNCLERIWAFSLAIKFQTRLYVGFFRPAASHSLLISSNTFGTDTSFGSIWDIHLCSSLDVSFFIKSCLQVECIFLFIIVSPFVHMTPVHLARLLCDPNWTHRHVIVPLTLSRCLWYW